MPQSDIYGVDVVPQFKNKGIDANIIATNLTYEPLKLDIDAFQKVIDTEIKQKQLEFNKEQLDYKKKVWEAEISQYYDTMISNSLTTMNQYLNKSVNDMKNGKTGYSPLPSVSKRQTEYYNRAKKIYENPNKEQASRDMKSLIYEMYANEDLRKGLINTSQWASTVKTINDIYTGKAKGYNTNNIDMEKFRKYNDMVEKGQDIPDEAYRIGYYLKSDPNAIIDKYSKKNIVLKETADYENIGEGEQGVIKYQSSGDRTQKSMADDMYNDLIQDTEFRNSYGNDDVKIALAAKEAVKDEINKTFQKNYKTFGEIPNEVFSRRTEITNVAESPSSKRKTAKIVSDRQFELEKVRQENRIKIEEIKQKNAIKLAKLNKNTKNSTSVKKLASEVKNAREVKNRLEMLNNELKVNPKIDAVATTDAAQTLVSQGITTIDSIVVDTNTAKNSDRIALLVYGKTAKEPDETIEYRIVLPTKEGYKKEWEQKMKINDNGSLLRDLKEDYDLYDAKRFAFSVIAANESSQDIGRARVEDDGEVSGAYSHLKGELLNEYLKQYKNEKGYDAKKLDATNSDNKDNISKFLKGLEKDYGKQDLMDRESEYYEKKFGEPAKYIFKKATGEELPDYLYQYVISMMGNNAGVMKKEDNLIAMANEITPFDKNNPKPFIETLNYIRKEYVKGLSNYDKNARGWNKRYDSEAGLAVKLYEDNKEQGLLSILRDKGVSDIKLVSIDGKPVLKFNLAGAETEIKVNNVDNYKGVEGYEDVKDMVENSGENIEKQDTSKVNKKEVKAPAKKVNPWAADLEKRKKNK